MVLKSKKMELLAPAGDLTSMKAAVLNGADAIYFGLSDFNARKRAANFKLEELDTIIDYLHARNVKGYLAFNTLLFSDELEKAQEFLKAAVRAGVDAIIIQDIGLAAAAKKLCPEITLHGSTQMTITNADATAVAARLGVKRVILARELSLEQIKQIAGASEMELEVFVHGALCMSYSGQCLASAVLAGRSANRGMCAQMCRLPYTMIVNGKQADTGGRKYLLSPADLSLINKTGQLATAGPVAVKIEGRLKNEYYVAAAVAAYRYAIDKAEAGENIDADEPVIKRLSASFSRGFCEGFINGRKHKELVGGTFARNRGKLVGTVSEIFTDEISIELTGGAKSATCLKPGDGVVIESSRGSEQGGRVYQVWPDGKYLSLGLGYDDIDLSRVEIGAAVFKTDDPALKREIEKTFARDTVCHRVGVSAEIFAADGEPLEIKFTDEKGNSAAVKGPVLEKARTRATTKEDIRVQLGRLGNTPFALKEVIVKKLDEVMIPASVLNDLRRRAVEELVAMRKKQVSLSISDEDAIKNLRLQSAEQMKTIKPMVEEGLSVLVRTMEQFKAAIESAGRVVMIYGDFNELEDFEKAAKLSEEAGVKFAPATLRVYMPGDEKHLEFIMALKPKTVLVRNIGALGVLKAKGFGQLIGDHSLNIVNELAAGEFLKLGLSRMTPGYDLCASRLADLAARCRPDIFEIMLHDRIGLFHTEHCVFANVLGSDGKCSKGCKDDVGLVEVKGLVHRVKRDWACRNTVYCGSIYSGAEIFDKLSGAGYKNFRISLLDEDGERSRKLIEVYSEMTTGRLAPARVLEEISLLYSDPITSRPLG